jgi:hypothetical protein
MPGISADRQQAGTAVHSFAKVRSPSKATNNVARGDVPRKVSGYSSTRGSRRHQIRPVEATDTHRTSARSFWKSASGPSPMTSGQSLGLIRAVVRVRIAAKD